MQLARYLEESREGSNESEYLMEVVANDSLSIKWFLGLAVDEAAPDHSTLTKFKSRLI